MGGASSHQNDGLSSSKRVADDVVTSHQPITVVNTITTPAVSWLSADEARLAAELVDPTRMEALALCDTSGHGYDRRSFLMALSIRGRNLELIAWPLAGLVAWSVAWAVVLHVDGPVQLGKEPVMVALLDPIETLFTPLLTALLTLLLVFRQGRAAVRFWDARAAAGAMVLHCRNVAAEVFALRPTDPAARGEVARWLCATPVAVKNLLRPLAMPDKDENTGPGDTRARAQSESAAFQLADRRLRELMPALSSEQARSLLAAPNQPLHAGARLRSAIGRACDRLPPAQRGLVHRGLHDELDHLNGAWGALERIAASPLPFIYVAHLRLTLLLFLAVAPLPSLSHDGWPAVPPFAVACAAILAVEAAAEECERPFLKRPNHLRLGGFCASVAENVAQALSDSVAAEH